MFIISFIVKAIIRKECSIVYVVQIPRNMRQMYCHAYQSLVWNKTVSQRIKKHGLAVLPGDVVFVADPPAVTSSMDGEGTVGEVVPDNADHRASKREARDSERTQQKLKAKEEKGKAGEKGKKAEEEKKTEKNGDEDDDEDGSDDEEPSQKASYFTSHY